MVQFAFDKKEITAKIVYYGPPLSGKTTNLQQIHNQANTKAVGRLMSLNTDEDRTLFFDLLPMHVKLNDGYNVKLKLFTVPGQIKYNSTRRLVLAGADAIVFIADSQRCEMEANKTSYKNLKENLVANRIDINLIPLVLQLNKRDLEDIISPKEFLGAIDENKYRLYHSTAVSGTGVMETFNGVLELLLKSMKEKLHL